MPGNSGNTLVPLPEAMKGEAPSSPPNALEGEAPAEPHHLAHREGRPPRGRVALHDLVHAVLRYILAAKHDGAFPSVLHNAYAQEATVLSPGHSASGLHRPESDSLVFVSAR